MKCLFLFNPKSGKEGIAKKINYISARLSEKFDIVDVHPSTSREDFINTARNACGVYDYLIFSGGDGSYNLVVNAIAEEKNQPILGYIPGGTCNDIAGNMHLPTKSLKKCLDIIIENEYVYHDLIKMNNEYCMYVASLGDFAELSYNTKHNVKKMFGRIAYYFSGLRTLLHTPHSLKLDLTIDGIPFCYESPLCLVLNSKFVAGLKFNTEGYLNDGKFDVIIVKGKYLRGLFNIIMLFLFGILKIKNDKVSYIFRASKFTIECKDEKYWAVDGEKGGTGKFEFECIPKRIKVISNLK